MKVRYRRCRNLDLTMGVTHLTIIQLKRREKGKDLGGAHVLEGQVKEKEEV
jgi:hypothetical protein